MFCARVRCACIYVCVCVSIAYARAVRKLARGHCGEMVTCAGAPGALDPPPEGPPSRLRAPQALAQGFRWGAEPGHS
jgi:hypothetical protein